MTIAPNPNTTTPDRALVSIGFLMDMTSRILWRNGGGHGQWEAALATLILAFEPQCKTRRLLEALPAEKNMDNVGLLNTMARLGYIGHPEKILLSQLEKRLLPCLFVPWSMTDKPIVCLSRQDHILTRYNSALHTIEEIDTTQKENDLYGTAYFFTPHNKHVEDTSKFIRSSTQKNWFHAVISRFSKSFRKILYLCLMLNIFALAPALFIMMAYDRIISPSDLSALPALAFGVGLALTAEWYLRDIRSDALSWMTARMDNIIGSQIFTHLLNLPSSLIERASISAQVARIKTFESVRDFFSSGIFLSFLEIPFVIVAFAVMAFISGPLILVPISMIVAYVILFTVMRKKIMKTMRLTAKSSSARQQFVLETFDHLKDLHINGLTQAWQKKFSHITGREILMNFQLNFLGSVAETLANAITIIAAVLTVGIGAHLIWTNVMSTGALVASMILVWRILMPFYSLCTMIPRIEQLRNSIIQINDLMDIDTEEDMAFSQASLPELKGTISFEHTHLRYAEQGDFIIQSLNTTIPAGTLTTIAGHNGAGKTSVLKMIQGLYRPTKGTVKMDGFDLRQMEEKTLRRQIAYVPQKMEFFPGTIIENLIIGNPFATMEDVKTALHMADIWRELSDCLFETMHENKFSKNILTKMALARCYIQNANVVLIDELPNAILNSTAGYNLRKYIKESKGQRTIVFVTHRGDMMHDADLTIQMTHGQPPLCRKKNNTLKPDKGHHHERQIA